MDNSSSSSNIAEGLCSSWRGVILDCVIVLGILSIWYCKIVFWDAAEACYVHPCYEGAGWQALWKLNKGVTFTGESSGVFFVVHALVGFLLFRKRQHDDDNEFLEQAHFVVGIFMGCTVCAGLLSVNMIWVWGAERNLIHNLGKINPNTPALTESGHHMTVDESLIGTFTLLSYLSAFICCLQLFTLSLILLARGSITSYFRLLGGQSSYEETMPLQPIPATTQRIGLYS